MTNDLRNSAAIELSNLALTLGKECCDEWGDYYDLNSIDRDRAADLLETYRDEPAAARLEVVSIVKGMLSEADDHFRQTDAFADIASQFNDDTDNLERHWEAFEKGMSIGLALTTGVAVDQIMDDLEKRDREVRFGDLDGYTAPSAWASYLMNNDATSFTEDDAEDFAAARAFRARLHVQGEIVDCEDAGFCNRFDADDLTPYSAADCQTYYVRPY